MIPNLIRIVVLIISWLSVKFIPKSAFRKYLPVSIFCRYHMDFPFIIWKL
ncbi:hypothetical protein [Cytobacillus praedii]|nr:hypothetical protein [Cytobacillus praedii]